MRFGGHLLLFSKNFSRGSRLQFVGHFSASDRSELTMKKQTRSALIILGFCLVACLACQTGRASWSIAKSLQGDGGQAPKEWIMHQDPTGFSVQLPRGWQARSDRSSGRIELQGQEGEQLFVWPIFIPSQSPQSVAEGYQYRQSHMEELSQRQSSAVRGGETSSFGKQTASSVLQKLAASLWPNAAW